MSHPKPLFSVIAGFERGGTSLILNILKQYPKLDSGFEGGILFASKPVNFLTTQPYCSMLEKGWKIPHNTLKDILTKSNNWQDVYQGIIQNSPLFPNKNIQIIDKTPKYLEHLPEILKKIPNVPCIVISRDPRAVIWSWIKRQDKTLNIDQACNRYLSYARGWIKARNNFDNIYNIQYEKLCSEPKNELKKIFNFLDLTYNDKYLDIIYNKNKCVHGNSITNKNIYEYKNFLSEKLSQKILNNTRSISEWHWN